MRLVIGSLVTALSASAAMADPVPILPEVFCFRITDIERISGLDGTDGNDFVFEFEVLNWSDTPAAGVVIASTIGTSGLGGFGSTSPTISGIGIDADGRGGALGGTDIDAAGLGLTSGSGTFDATAIHSGRGRGDVPGNLNDWSATAFTATSATWGIGGGTIIPNRDLVAAGPLAALLVPGVPPVLDSLGDSAVDGGPGPYTAGTGSGPPPAGTGNVLDGFTLTLTDWDVNETFSFNWNLLNGAGDLIGTTTRGNPYGFGAVNLLRLDQAAPIPPGGVFIDNTGFANAGSNLFFDSVWDVPNPTQFAGEFSAGIIAPFQVPTDNTFEQVANTSLVPVPPAGFLYAGLMLLLYPLRRFMKAGAQAAP